MDGGSEKLSRYVGKSLPKGNVELVLYSVWAGDWYHVSILFQCQRAECDGSGLQFCCRRAKYPQ